MKNTIQQRRHGQIGRERLAAMLLLITAAISGCRPEFQNAVVDAFETGVRGVVDAALDVIFTEARPN